MFYIHVHTVNPEMVVTSRYMGTQTYLLSHNHITIMLRDRNTLYQAVLDHFITGSWEKKSTPFVYIPVS